MGLVTDHKTERQYYIDWLRILLIISVFLYHIGMIFNCWPWHIKNDRQYDGFLQQIMSFLHCWRMPLFFMLSGAGTYFALGKRTPGQYLSERFKRLFIPLVVGIFTLVPVQVYLEKIPAYSSLPDFYSHMFEGIYPQGNFSWHHLWFIAYLFVISLLVTPLLNFLRSARFETFRVRTANIVTKPFALNIFIIPLLLSQVLLRPFFGTETNDLVNDWASLTYYVIFFIAGYLLLPSNAIVEAIRKYRVWYLAETILITFGMFSIPQLFESGAVSEITREVLSIFVAWLCSVTAIGYSKQYLNKNSEARRVASEAIYPFYLLHQPIIVVIGYFTVQWGIASLWKAAIIISSSFTAIAFIYWFLIKPNNLFRIIFGMKRLRREKLDTIHHLKPIMAEADTPSSGIKQKYY